MNPAAIWTDTLRHSEYMGWVAYTGDGVPIFEHVPPGNTGGFTGVSRSDFRAGYVQPTPDALVLPQRELARNCLNWDMLPHEKIHRVEVYFGREHIPPEQQPAIHFEKKRPEADVRFFQRKQTAVIVHAGGGLLGPGDMAGQQRTGIHWYRLGFYSIGEQVAGMVEVSRKPYKIAGRWEPVFEFPGVRNPTWPHPNGEPFDVTRHGYGINPDTIRPALPAHLLTGPPVPVEAEA